MFFWAFPAFFAAFPLVFGGAILLAYDAFGTNVKNRL